MDHHAALIYTMVLISAADSDMTDAELRTIGDIVQHLPVFEGFDPDKLVSTAAACAEVLSKEDGFDEAVGLIQKGLPPKLAETAYALACDVAAADGMVSQEELELLADLRYRLAVGRLPAAAIERGAKARYSKL